MGPIAARDSRDAYLSAAEAQSALGVARRSLYTYVSRGWIRRRQEGRRSLYLAEDVRRIALRSAARRGHAAVAAGALRWGEPVLDSAITLVADDRLFYRGRDVIAWLEQHPSYEEVGDWVLGAPRPEVWPRATHLPAAGRTPFDRMLSMTPALQAIGAEPRQDERLLSARRIVLALSGAFGGARGSRIAARIASGLKLGDESAPAIDVALIVSADHELNASSFAARIAAGTGAPLGSSVGAALFAFNGPRHGRSHDHIETFVAALPQRGLAARLRSEMRAGTSVPGFGHRLYPRGDPRARPLLALARQLRPKGRTLALIDAYRELTGEEPTIDVALVALAESLGAPRGTATALFALGRSVGWLAHAMEQAASSEPIRPRARYVGPVPGTIVK